MRRRVPWSMWVAGWLTAIVLAGGVAEVVSRSNEPDVDTVVDTVQVLPEGQAKVSGSFTSLQGTDVLAPPLWLPIVLDTGTATIATGDETIVWDGGRPFRLEGRGGIDLGPTEVTIDEGGAHWPLDGIRVLIPGQTYEVRAPVAVGRAGLAEAHDSYSFTPMGGATIESTAVVTTPPGDLSLEGPGSLVLDGRFEILTAEGRRTATHLEFGPGPFELDVRADRSFEATLQGPLR